MARIQDIRTIHFQFAEQSTTVATPAASTVRVYAKTDGKLYYKDDAGTEYEVGTSSAVVTLAHVRKYSVLGLGG